MLFHFSLGCIHCFVVSIYLADYNSCLRTFLCRRGFSGSKPGSVTNKVMCQWLIMRWASGKLCLVGATMSVGNNPRLWLGKQRQSFLTKWISDYTRFQTPELFRGMFMPQGFLENDNRCISLGLIVFQYFRHWNSMHIYQAHRLSCIPSEKNHCHFHVHRSIIVKEWNLEERSLISSIHIAQNWGRGEDILIRSKGMHWFSAIPAFLLGSRVVCLIQARSPTVNKSSYTYHKEGYFFVSGASSSKYVSSV